MVANQNIMIIKKHDYNRLLLQENKPDVKNKKYVKIISMEGLQKAGEALLAFANIVTALVFLKSFWLTSNQSDLIGGAIFWVGTYVVGIALINFSSRRKQNE